MMKSLYVTSVERYSGKTAVCLALGEHLMDAGYKVGYLKPLSLQPWHIGSKTVDQDAAFVRAILKLDADLEDLSPVVVDSDLLCEHLKGCGQADLMSKVKDAVDAAGAGRDILLMEGGGSLREGYVVGLPTPKVAAELGSKVLAVVKYRGDVRMMDDALAAAYRLGDALSGVIINRVPASDAEFVEEIARPCLEDMGITVLGILPEVRSLAALTVKELLDVLDATVLTEVKFTDQFIETLTVGAMNEEAALSRFRRQRNKAVITGGDRTGIQLAALETSTTCLILTGNLHPNPLIIRQADQMGVPVLLVSENTMETVEMIDHIFGRTRLGQKSKLDQFKDLLIKQVDISRLYKALGL
ncbi:MAG: phosphotransacetylase family protein [Chloroflexota bacterium]|nr:phosphotransacetylase family protein [Chloroflexota bacterium]